MLEPLLGSKSAERVLVYLFCRSEGYARKIAGFYDTSVTPIQQQLTRLENGGVLVSKLLGRTRLYEFNPRYPFVNELKVLLEKALTFYSPDLKERLLVYRSRPRKVDKPL
jgi:hypothetical protein